ncbi:hypothetical protein [Streptomyces sp. NPDC088923]|uniref:hypothetical protein n=1 Tax=Streptomyces sp. NPDC088923 TaxID=3365913 RepID=UPI003821118B
MRQPVRESLFFFAYTAPLWAVVCGLVGCVLFGAGVLRARDRGVSVWWPPDGALGFAGVLLGLAVGGGAYGLGFWAGLTGFDAGACDAVGLPGARFEERYTWPLSVKCVADGGAQVREFVPAVVNPLVVLGGCLDLLGVGVLAWRVVRRVRARLWPSATRLPR